MVEADGVDGIVLGVNHRARIVKLGLEWEYGGESIFVRGGVIGACIAAFSVGVADIAVLFIKSWR